MYLKNPISSSNPKPKKKGTDVSAKGKRSIAAMTGLPPRPYTEYNIFFRIERARMLQSAGLIDDEIVCSLDPSHVDPLECPRPAGYEFVSLPPYWYSRSSSSSDAPTRKRRKHRKREGGMDLKTLSRTVSASWRGASAAVVNYCRGLAQAEMDGYNSQVERINKKKKKRSRVVPSKNDAAAATEAPSKDLGRPSKSLGIIIPGGAVHLDNVAVSAGGRALKILEAPSKKPEESARVISEGATLFPQDSIFRNEGQDSDALVNPVHTCLVASIGTNEASCSASFTNECTNNETIIKSLQHQLKYAYAGLAQLGLGNDSLDSVAVPSESLSPFPNDGRFASVASGGSGRPLPAMTNKRKFAPRISSPLVFARSAQASWPLQHDAREGAQVRPDDLQPLRLAPTSSTFPNGAPATKKRKSALTVSSAPSPKFASGAAVRKPQDADDGLFFGVYHEVSVCSSDKQLLYQRDELLLETRVGNFFSCFNHVPDWKKEDADQLLDMLDLPPGSSSDYGETAGPDRADYGGTVPWSMQIASDTNPL